MQRRADAWEQAGDRRYIFLRCYSMMTANMLEALQQDRFHHRYWVENLLHLFADYYYLALEAYEYDPASAPRVWQDAHEKCAQPDLNVLQYLLLGINAHINYDLVLTLYEVLNPEWSSLDLLEQKARYTDHCLVNQIIAETIDEVQDEVIERVSPALNWVDRLLGRLDERMLSALINHWREEVWEYALDMVNAGPARFEPLRAALEASTLQKARLIS